MATEKEEVIRYNTEIPASLDARIKNRIPWGIKSDLTRRLITLLAESLEQDGAEIIAALLENRVELTIIKK